MLAVQVEGSKDGEKQWQNKMGKGVLYLRWGIKVLKKQHTGTQI